MVLFILSLFIFINSINASQVCYIDGKRGVDKPDCGLQFTSPCRSLEFFQQDNDFYFGQIVFNVVDVTDVKDEIEKERERIVTQTMDESKLIIETAKKDANLLIDKMESDAKSQIEKNRKEEMKRINSMGLKNVGIICGYNDYTFYCFGLLCFILLGTSIHYYMKFQRQIYLQSNVA